MSKYSLLFLTPGQQPPEGSTGIALANGGIVQIHKDDSEKISFTSTVKVGFSTATDQKVTTKYDIREMTEKEIKEYEDCINPTTTVSGVK